jgi:ABC-type bacteriocin/lantibiotic exporter with double-glycine peptidase domain
MAFEEIKENSEDLLEQAKSFLETNVSYYKLWLFKATMKSGSKLIQVVVLSFLLMIATLFLSVAAALAIGYALENHALGFLIVAGIYILLGLIIYKSHGKMVEGPMMKKLSAVFFNDKS